jgi:hypothetical protein
MRALIFLALALVMACTAKDQYTKVPPSDGPAKYPEKFNIIGGTEVAQGDPKYSSVIKISTDGAACTASVVGPQAILTAAHCGKNDAESTFSVAGKQYKAVISRSPIYPGVDHDVALGLVSEAIENIQYEQISAASLSEGDEVNMFGYGCIQPGGGGGNDGILRYGSSQITSFSAKDFVAKKPDGAALCFGDSGGPAFGKDGMQIGIASKGNISDTSYFANLRTQESKDFLEKWAKDNSVDICGVTKDCQGPEPVTISVASENLGELTFILEPETLDPDYVKRHMEMLMQFLDKSFITGSEEPLCE